MSFLLAFSPAQGGDPTQQMLSTVIMFGAVMAIFYFMILRPQKKREDEQKKLLEALKQGDKVILSSGIHGSIASVDNDNNVVNVNISDNVKIRVNKAAVATIVPKA
ncbi:MAG: preprotein translocase subunit YajC [Candidatus Kapaibacterium sp.]|nr:MAG: preprotein translocase subunit YajC [Candidatus Kapabacteria bacterium]